jgi:hypothetical protein
VSVLREAALRELRRAVRRRRLVVAENPAVLARARRRGRLAIDAGLVAEALLRAEPALVRRDCI